MMQSFRKLLFCVTLVSVATSAHAQWTVWDPTNWAQNYSQAASGIKTEINTAQSLIQQTNAAIDMAKSVKSLKNFDSLSDIQTALKLYNDLKYVGSRIDQDLKNVSAITERLTAQYGASNFSWKEFLQSRDELNKQQRDTAAKRYAAVNASLEQNAKQRQAIVQQLGAVQGQTEAMQSVGAAIDVMIGQNQQMISILATNNQVAETKELLQDVSHAKSAEEYNKHQQRLREAAAKYK